MAVKKTRKKTVKAKRPAPSKKRTSKKPAAAKPKPSKRVSPKARGMLKPSVVGLELIGEVTHYFAHVSAGVIKLTAELKAGDMVQIKGHTTDFKQPVGSMQIERKPVTEAKKGQEIGLKVKDRVRIGDAVYKV